MQTNNIELMWKRQKSFQKNFFNPDLMSEEEKVFFTKENILCVHRELGEILSAIPSKSYRANKKEYDVEHVREEIVDAFKFLLNVAIIFGMTPETFYNKFIEKSDIVDERYEKEKHEIH